MPKLSVQFELSAPDATIKGKEAGQAFSTAFRQEVNRNLATAVPKALISALTGGSTSTGIITPPGLARPADVFQRMLIGPLMKPLFPPTAYPKSLQAFFNQSLGIGQGQNVFKGAGRKSYEEFWKGAVEANKDPNRLKNLLLGIGATPFSSWIGSRLLSDSFFGSKGGKGGGGHGGLLGAGGAGGFAEFFIGIELLKKAFEYGSEKIREVVEKGFQLYVRSNQLRRSVGQLFSIQEAGQQVGLSQEQIDQFMLRNNWGKARTSLQNFGVFSQLGGMSGDFKNALRWSMEIQGQWERTARTSYEIHMNVMRIKTDWLTMWNDSGFLTALDKLVSGTDRLLHTANLLGVSMRSSMWQWGVAGVMGWADSHRKQFPTGSGNGTNDLFPLKQTLPQMGAWEKMGFVIGGGKADKQDRIIGQLDMAITIWKQILQKISGGHSIPAYTGTGNQNFNPP
jgi:hypothetical protein